MEWRGGREERVRGGSEGRRDRIIMHITDYILFGM